MKNFAWNDLTLAQWEALDRGFDTAILTDNTGIITEGPGFNVGFISHDGFVYAPKRNCLRGTVMNQVAQLCNDHGKNFMYADFTEYELTYESTAMFLTSTAGNVITVSQFEQKKFKENETLKWLQANLQ
jgi:branched-chain amino acid aminotransferase